MTPLPSSLGQAAGGSVEKENMERMRESERRNRARSLRAHGRRPNPSGLGYEKGLGQ